MTEEMLVPIRLATLADIPALRQLCIDTFTDTYAAYNTPEDMQLYIDTNFNPERLAGEINSSTSQYYMAFAGEAPAGYIQLRKEEALPELAGTPNIEIGRIYVAPKLKGLKIGKRLIDHAAAVAAEQHCQVLWLGVWQQNKNAIGFYTKQGFTIFGEHIFVLGTDEQTDWLMKKEILPTTPV